MTPDHSRSDALWRRFPTWSDWIVAAVAAAFIRVIVQKLADDGSIEGNFGNPTVTLTAPTAHYSALALVGGVLTAAFVVAMLATHGHARLAAMGVRSYGFVCGVGFASQLLDRRYPIAIGPASDGPDAVYVCIELVAYGAAAFGALRLFRIASMVSRAERPPEPDEPAPPVDEVVAIELKRI
jgi:hypothetical protein